MHFQRYKTLLTGLLCVLTIIISCKDNSTDSSGDATAVGLWKLNSTEGDISYVKITTSTVTYYDFQGDEMDQGEDCYLIESEEILEVDGNIYRFRDPEDSESTIDIEVTVTGTTLTVKQPFGNGIVTIEFTKYNGNTSSFTPECVEQGPTTVSKSTFWANPF